MKRITFYIVDFETQSGLRDQRRFGSKRKALKFAKDCGDPEWFIGRHTQLGIGMRKGADRRDYKKARTIFYFWDGLTLSGDNWKGRSPNQAKQAAEEREAFAFNHPDSPQRAARSAAAGINRISD